MSEESSEQILGYLEKYSGQSVEEVINTFLENGLSSDEAARTLYTLWREGRVGLEDTKPPSNFLRYLLSLYSGWFWLLSISLFLMILFIYYLPQTIPLSYIRIVLGFLTALYLPGSALIETLYPIGNSLEPLERFGLSVGTSLAVTPLIGFVLNYTPWGIRLEPIVISVTIFTVLLGIAAVYRKFTYFRLRIETLAASV